MQPERSAASAARIRAGWRLVEDARLSGRVQSAATGRPSVQAATASGNCTDWSSLPPNPPPTADGITRTRSGAMPSTWATSSRSM